jgi:hypothetical protein
MTRREHRWAKRRRPHKDGATKSLGHAKKKERKQST